MLSAITRPKTRQFMGEYEFDLLIIGGGITGAGIALDAVTRGLSVALIDMQDFAGGTSSRSTKLIHGGLRYLKQLEVKMVAETGREREIVYQNAMHVTKPERMLLPFYQSGTFGKYTTSAGLLVYDWLAGVKKEERRAMLTAEETIEMEPLVKRQGLLGGGHYVEYRTDDARLTIEIVKKAVQKGALCLNYARAEKFLYDNGKVIGVVAQDIHQGGTFPIHAKHTVNATGPWVDDVRNEGDISHSKKLRLTKGVHIVVDRSVFPLQQAVYFDAPDGRMIFAIPRDAKAYIGTTDTFYDSDPQTPFATEEDIRYLLGTIKNMFPKVVVNRQHVESTWAGIRPLIYEEGKDPSEISRKDEIWEAESGLISIAGGKLTGYRKMAETVVDVVVSKYPRHHYGPCVTEHLPLSGGDFGGIEKYQAFLASKTREAALFGLAEEEGKRLSAFYGTNVDIVFTYAHALQGDDFDLPTVVKAEIFYAVHHEMALTPSDFLIRRKGDLYFNIAFVECLKEPITAFMGRLLDYDDDEKRRHLHELDMHIARAKGDVRQ